VTGYLFDTDILGSVMKRDPPLALVRRLAQVAPELQFTTAIRSASFCLAPPGAERRPCASRP
jgi:hypothetical protein